MIQLISEKILKQYSLIDDNVDGLYITPSIQLAQETGLQPLLGGPLYRRLLAMVENGDIQGDTNYKKLLDDYCIPYLMYKVMSEIQIPLAFKMRNQGVVTTTDDHSFNSDIRDVQYIKNYYDDKAKFYANRLSDYLVANAHLYPEYRHYVSGEMKSNSKAYNTGIVLSNNSCNKSLRRIFNN